MTNNFLFTSESVTEGHPDKICDNISDAFLDEYLKQDPNSRVAVETMVTTDFVVVSGEVTSKAIFDKKAQEELVRKTIRDIGYNDKELMFDGDTCKVDLRLHSQSPDISQGVTATEEKESENRRSSNSNSRSHPFIGYVFFCIFVFSTSTNHRLSSFVYLFVARAKGL